MSPKVLRSSLSFIVFSGALGCTLLRPTSRYDEETNTPLPDASLPVDDSPLPAPSCTDGTKNGAETDADCGGACSACDFAHHCLANADCKSSLCSQGFCVDPTCTDKQRGGAESDVDCGGSECAPCAAGGACSKPSDCVTRRCTGSRCSVASSCKEIKDVDPTARDDVYTIHPDPGSSGSVDVFCDMTTDGGGWTLFAHVNQDSNVGKLFEADVGTYRADRLDDETTFGIGGRVLGFLHHTHMMLALDTPDPRAAAAKKKVVFYEYTDGHPGFTKGPVPCQGLNDFSYRAALEGPFVTGGGSARCDGVYWFSFATNKGYLVCLTADPTKRGTYWGAIMGGNNSYGHDGWFYAR